MYVRLANYEMMGCALARAPRLFTCKYAVRRIVPQQDGLTDGATCMFKGTHTLNSNKDAGVPDALSFSDASELDPHLVDGALVLGLIIEEVV
jgi:hypothetical protein